MEKTKRNTTKSPKNIKNIKSVKPKTHAKTAMSAKNAKLMKNIKTTKSPKPAKKQTKSPTTAAHWIESRARLVKILEATGIQPESSVVMIGCYKKEQRA